MVNQHSDTKRDETFVSDFRQQKHWRSCTNEVVTVRWASGFWLCTHIEFGGWVTKYAQNGGPKWHCHSQRHTSTPKCTGRYERTRQREWETQQSISLKNIRIVLNVTRHVGLNDYMTVYTTMYVCTGVFRDDYDEWTLQRSCTPFTAFRCSRSMCPRRVCKVSFCCLAVKIPGTVRNSLFLFPPSRVNASRLPVQRGISTQLYVNWYALCQT